jgi:hypothetical protein
MSRQSDQETARVEDKIDLGLFLVEHLMREMISRGALGEAALARIMDGVGKSVPALSNSEELRGVYEQIRQRLERCIPTTLQRADRDRDPATED